MEITKDLLKSEFESPSDQTPEETIRLRSIAVPAILAFQERQEHGQNHPLAETYPPSRQQAPPILNEFLLKHLVVWAEILIFASFIPGIKCLAKQKRKEAFLFNNLRCLFS